MKRRLYFVLPDVSLARTVHNELLLARVPEHHMHVITREGMDLGDLPPASLWQKSDVWHAMQLAIPLAGITGIVAGVLAILAGAIAPGYEAKSILAMVVASLFVGVMAASLIGVSVPNTRHAPFEEDLRKGRLLFIVDVPVQRVEEITDLVTRHHPEAHSGGIEPNIPVFP